MVYCNSTFIEQIHFHPVDERNNVCHIQMHKGYGMFIVTCNCAPDWNYSFNMNDVSDYERVKFNIMAELFEYEEIDELLDRLSFVFEDGFADILIEENLAQKS